MKHASIPSILLGFLNKLWYGVVTPGHRKALKPRANAREAAAALHLEVQLRSKAGPQGCHVKMQCHNGRMLLPVRFSRLGIWGTSLCARDVLFCLYMFWHAESLTHAGRLWRNLEPLTPNGGLLCVLWGSPKLTCHVLARGKVQSQG